jgi:hypothetical protein
MGLCFLLVFVPLAELNISLQMIVIIGVEAVVIAIMSLTLIYRSDYFYNQLTT